ncbi:MAG: type II secretion system protein, partial [Bdellovibrionales bacterium]
MGKRASYFRFRQRGFTLTEVAIVMLVVSVIIASIWTAASLVREKSHVSTAM